MAYETNMGDLIGRVKTLLQSKTVTGQSLYGVRQVKRGILPQRFQLPIITIIPVREEIIKQQGSCAYVSRSLSVFVFVDSRKKSDTINLQKYADAVVEILRADRALNDGNGNPTVYDMEFGGIEYDDEREGAEITVNYYSQETLPSRNLATTIADNPRIDAIASNIHTKLKNLKASTLSGFSQILLENWGNVANRLLPALTVEADREEIDDRSSGRDQISTRFSIQIMSKVASASDNTLTSHLALLEPLKDALQAEANWSGTCTDSRVSTISFSSAMDTNDLLYRTEITLDAESRHSK